MAVFESLSEKLQAIAQSFGSKKRITDTDLKRMMREIRLALLEADVHYQVVKMLLDEISEKAKGQEILSELNAGQQIVKIVQTSLTDILGASNSKLAVSPTGFTVIMLYGLQGSGKTTTAAKLGKLLKESGKKPLLCSVDTHRPAAAKQLEILAQAIGVPVYIEPEEKDAVAIAKRAEAKAKYLLCDTLIVDTAGRQTVDDDLMTELKAIANVVGPHEKLLVVDSMIGQEAVNIALEFERQTGLTGFILTKLDGDARGGAALSIYHLTQKPIKYITTGEKVDAIEVFHPDRMANRILGMGDVLSLIDKLTAKMDEKKAEESLKNLQNNTFSLNDMLDQLLQVKEMGSLKDLVGLIPGMNSKKLDSVNVDDGIIDKQIAIIRSMTMKERRHSQILNASRRKRIAEGAGVKVQDVNMLVKQYEQAMGMMKKMGFTAQGRGKKRKGRSKKGFGGFGGFNPFGSGRGGFPF